MKKFVFVLVGAFALASSTALAKDLKAPTAGVSSPAEMSDSEMDKVTGGGLLDKIPGGGLLSGIGAFPKPNGLPPVFPIALRLPPLPKGITPGVGLGSGFRPF